MKLFLMAALFVTTSAFSQQIPVPIPWPGPNCRTIQETEAMEARIWAVCQEKLSLLEREKGMVCQLTSSSNIGCWGRCEIASSEFTNAVVRMDTTFNCTRLEKIRVLKTVIKYKR